LKKKIFKLTLKNKKKIYLKIVKLISIRKKNLNKRKNYISINNPNLSTLNIYFVNKIILKKKNLIKIISFILILRAGKKIRKKRKINFYI
jgi:hypothetical protein